MLSKLKLLVIISIIAVLAIPFSACQRLKEPAEEVISEEEKEEEKDMEKQKDEPVVSKKPEEKAHYLIPFEKNNGFDATYGYMDQDGNIVIEPRFKKAEPFYESGVALVSDSNDMVGLINQNGEYLIEPKWENLFYSEGMFLGYQSESDITTVFDAAGKQMFQKQGYIGEFSEGFAQVYGEGYIDTTGKIVIGLGYDLITPFVNGIAEVAQDYLSPSYYIDKQGNDMTEKVSSGLKMYKDEATGLYGFQNMKGDIIINAQYYEASPFLYDHALVNVGSDFNNGRYGVIDTNGNWVIEPKYCGIIRMKNGIIAVGEEIDDDEYNSYQYFSFCKKALYTADFKKSTGWDYNLVENLDKDTIYINDEKSVCFLDSNLEPAKGLPELPGRGYTIVRDGNLLRGYFNNILTVLDTKGNTLAKERDEIDLGGGIISKNQVDLSSPAANISYPVISGMKDNSLQKKINDTIYTDMIAPNKEFGYLNGPNDSSYLECNYVISRQKNLLLIDQRIYTYYFGAAHGYSFRNTLYIDVDTGGVYTLADLFTADSGAWDYLSNIVKMKMDEKQDEVGYFVEDVDITDKNQFAITKDSLVIYFAEGEIAAYVAGMQEFFIPFSDLDAYINTQGDFWKAFR